MTTDVPTEGRRLIWATGLVACVVLGVYAQVYNHGFIDYDDPSYVSENPHVVHGLTLAGVRWAFTTGHMGNWHPLTWLSLMLDVQLFGLHPGALHLVNVVLHLTNTLLLFALLRRMTHAAWPSLTVAALFGLHPLHVESVAWIAERKDVLSTLACFLTLWAYARYAETRSSRWYAATVASLALGLMAKAMLVTVPFLLLLLDAWPLGRLVLPVWTKPERRDSPQRHGKKIVRRANAVPPATLLWEKVPLFALTVVASVLAYLMQLRSGAIDRAGALPVGLRLENALVSYVRYLGKAVWPANLGLIYPYDTSLPMWQPAAAALCLAAVTILVVRRARPQPYLLVGWLWYLGTLVPVIGLVQIGSQALADRYTYVPLVGVFIMLAWGGRDAVVHWATPQPVVAAVVTGIMGAYAVAAWAQVGVWRSSESVLAHTVRVTRRNCVARNNLGFALATAGKTDAALEQYREAVRIKPDYADAYNNIGAVLMHQGQQAAAVEQFRTALRFNPRLADAHNNLGLILSEQGHTDAALAQLSEAVRVRPDYADAHNNLGNVLRAAGRLPDAIHQYEEALRLDPEYAGAHSNLAVALREVGRAPEAVVQGEEAVRRDPDSPQAHDALGSALAAMGRLREAEEHYARAVQLKPDYASAHNNLGSLLAGEGRFEDASAEYEHVLRLEPGNAMAHYNLGMALAKLGRLPAAIEEYRQVVQLTPDDAEAWHNLALAYAAVGQPAAASDAARHALSLARFQGHAALAESIETWVAAHGAP